GGPGGGLLQACNPSSPAFPDSDCSRFQWATGPNLPQTLDGGGGMTTIGSMFVGCYADGGSCPPAATAYRIVFRVTTSDPYATTVDVPFVAWVRRVQ
ncbi:MAG: hypothetical protein JNK82_36650, partial [Myxococcaceae bacterium]|nr:hypothetical protein [Myxococcaceae bacterium]